MLDTARVRGEAGVAGELGRADELLAQLRPFGILMHGEQDAVAVGGEKDAVRSDRMVLVE